MTSKYSVEIKPDIEYAYKDRNGIQEKVLSFIKGETITITLNQPDDMKHWDFKTELLQLIKKYNENNEIPVKINGL